jgi:hypothetical protein
MAAVQFHLNEHDFEGHLQLQHFHNLDLVQQLKEAKSSPTIDGMLNDVIHKKNLLTDMQALAMPMLRHIRTNELMKKHVTTDMIKIVGDHFAKLQQLWESGELVHKMSTGLQRVLQTKPTKTQVEKFGDEFLKKLKADNNHQMSSFMQKNKVWPKNQTSLLQMQASTNDKSSDSQWLEKELSGKKLAKKAHALSGLLHTSTPDNNGIFAVEVPPTAHEGSVLDVESPWGNRIHATVPANTAVGELFEVKDPDYQGEEAEAEAPVLRSSEEEEGGPKGKQLKKRKKMMDSDEFKKWQKQFLAVHGEIKVVNTTSEDKTPKFDNAYQAEHYAASHPDAHFDINKMFPYEFEGVNFRFGVELSVGCFWEGSSYGIVLFPVEYLDTRSITHFWNRSLSHSLETRDSSTLSITGVELYFPPNDAGFQIALLLKGGGEWQTRVGYGQMGVDLYNYHTDAYPYFCGTNDDQWYMQLDAAIGTDFGQEEPEHKAGVDYHTQYKKKLDRADWCPFSEFYGVEIWFPLDPATAAASKFFFFRDKLFFVTLYAIFFDETPENSDLNT